MTRKTPLRPKKPWRPQRKPMAKGKGLKPRTVERRREETVYYSLKRSYVERPGNRHCAVCLCLALARPWPEVKADVMGGALNPDALARRSTEVHHFRGRIGRLLCDTRFFIGTCRAHREWPHENARQARALVLLAPSSEWEVFPGPEIAGFPEQLIFAK